MFNCVNNLVKFTLTLLMFLASSAVFAKALNTEQAQAYLNMPNQHNKGIFEQKKFFKVLSKPFVSSGFYQLSDVSFEWTTTQPVASSLIFDGQTLWQTSSNSDKNKLPAAGHYVNVLKALVIGEFSALSSMFSFTKAKTEAKGEKCILLTPIDKQMTIIAETISLCFSNQTLVVQLNEQNGNHTEIRLLLEE